MKARVSDVATCAYGVLLLSLAGCRCNRPTPGGGPPPADVRANPEPVVTDSGVALSTPDASSTTCAVLPASGVEVTGYQGTPQAMSFALGDSEGLFALEAEEPEDGDGNVSRVVYRGFVAREIDSTIEVGAVTRVASASASASASESPSGDEANAQAGSTAGGDGDGGAASGSFVRSWGVATSVDGFPALWTFLAQQDEEGAGFYGLREIDQPVQSSEALYNEGGPLAAASRPRFALAAMIGRAVEEVAPSPTPGTAQPSSSRGDDGGSAVAANETPVSSAGGDASAASAETDAAAGAGAGAGGGADASVAPRGKVSVVSVLYDGRRMHLHNIYTPRGSSRYDEPDSPAVAVGATRSAIMFRASNRLWIAPIGGNGYVAMRLHQIVSGEVGPPSIAFRGDTLYAVWAQRDTRRSPWSLRWVSWNPFTDPDPTPQVLLTGTSTFSATAPSLVVTNDRFVLAWADGDNERSTVRVASTTGDFASLAARAVTVSPDGVDARRPVLGATDSGSRILLGWQSRSGAAAPNAVRVATLSCP